MFSVGIPSPLCVVSLMTAQAIAAGPIPTSSAPERRTGTKAYSVSRDGQDIPPSPYYAPDIFSVLMPLR